MEFNLAVLHEAIARRVPEREYLITGGRRLRWAEAAERTRRLAAVLRGAGLGVVRERAQLAPWESGQDSLALYLYNGPEYLEGLFGAFRARVAPFNVNYRYVEAELLQLFGDAGVRAILYHAGFAPTLARVLPRLPHCALLLQVEDGSGEPLLPGALHYEAALAAASPADAGPEPSPDDLYLLYTGGTTGLPKGVLWRQADIFVAALGGRDRDECELRDLEAAVARACAHPEPLRVLPAPPFMHAAAHWSALSNLLRGNAVVIQDEPRRLDADDLWRTAERERASLLLIVGDAYAAPLLEQLARGRYDLSALRYVQNGGAPLHPQHKRAFVERIPGLRILDAMGSSEAGYQGMALAAQASAQSPAPFEPGPGSCVLSEDLGRVLAPGSAELGWFARSGRTPLGYLGDAAKTARTFPVVAGVRYAVPGDRARALTSGAIEVLGRDASTINSGGEKIFAEEVEQALRSHPAVYDVVVVGRPSARWGQEVVALVQLCAGAASVTGAELREACAHQLARYKLPREVLFLDRIVRSPSGKADYRWARQQLEIHAPA